MKIFGTLLIICTSLSVWALEPIDIEQREREVEALEAKLDQADDDEEAEEMELQLEVLGSGLDVEAEFAELTEWVEMMEAELAEAEEDGLIDEQEHIKQVLARTRESRVMHEKVVVYWRRMEKELPGADREHMEPLMRRGHFLFQDVNLKRQRKMQQAELRHAQRELELLSATREIAEMRVRQMLKSAEQRAALSHQWAKIGAAWENDQGTEEMEEKFHHAMQKLAFEEQIVDREVHHAHLKLEAARTKDADERELLGKIMVANHAVGEQVRKVFRLILAGNTDGAEAMEEEGEGVHRALDLAERTLHLHRAERRGEDEEAAEIREEIAEIKSE